MQCNHMKNHTHKHTHTTTTWPYQKPCRAFVLHSSVWTSLFCCCMPLSLTHRHKVARQHIRMHDTVSQNNINAHRLILSLIHVRTHTHTHTHGHKVIYTHHAAPHFCLGKKVITFSPCLNAFKSLSGAIPRWASEIHLNSFWESKQSYCCTLKLWLEREKKWEEEEEGAGGRLVNKTVGRYYFSLSLSPISFYRSESSVL